MTTLLRFHDRLVAALAYVAGAIIVVATALIIYDVTLRNLLISPPDWTTPFAEYGLLYVTMCMAPWLVRTRGHVMVEVLHQALPPRARARLEKLVYVLCIAVCVVACGYLADLVVEAWRSGEVEARTIEMPRWLLYAPMLAGFFLVGLEFLRYLCGIGTLYHRSSVDAAADEAGVE